MGDFDVKGFYGIVQLKGWAPFPDGRQYIGVVGKCSVIRDKDMVGFEVAGGETANWLVRVDGPSGSINILGCQIKMVHQYDRVEELARIDDHGNYYRVP